MPLTASSSRSPLAERISKAVAEYAANDQIFTDYVMLSINPATGEVAIIDNPDPEIVDTDTTHDYVALMDLVEINVADPSQWLPDQEAIASLAAEYPGL